MYLKERAVIIINEITIIYDNQKEREEIKKHRITHLEDIETSDTQFTYFKSKSVLMKDGTKWKEEVKS